jgi:hypothetical protein
MILNTTVYIHVIVQIQGSLNAQFSFLESDNNDPCIYLFCPEDVCN